MSRANAGDFRVCGICGCWNGAHSATCSQANCDRGPVVNVFPLGSIQWAPPPRPPDLAVEVADLKRRVEELERRAQ